VIPSNRYCSSQRGAGSEGYSAIAASSQLVVPIIIIIIMVESAPPFLDCEHVHVGFPHGRSGGISPGNYTINCIEHGIEPALIVRYENWLLSISFVYEALYRNYA
jgi:hypothetical protein